MPDLVPLDNPILHRPAEPVAAEEFGTAELRTAEARLVQAFDLFFTNFQGVGLAAPQIGLNKRIAVVEDYGRRPSSPRWQADLTRVQFPRVVMVNPDVLTTTGDLLCAWETCLSEPDTFGLVERAREVRVQHRTVDGAGVDFVVQDWAARIVAHEVDHLNGCLCSRRYLPGSRLSADEYRREWKDRPLAEALRAFRRP